MRLPVIIRPSSARSDGQSISGFLKSQRLFLSRNSVAGEPRTTSRCRPHGARVLHEHALAIGVHREILPRRRALYRPGRNVPERAPDSCERHLDERVPIGELARLAAVVRAQHGVRFDRNAPRTAGRRARASLHRRSREGRVYAGPYIDSTRSPGPVRPTRSPRSSKRTTSGASGPSAPISIRKAQSWARTSGPCASSAGAHPTVHEQGLIRTPRFRAPPRTSRSRTQSG